MSPTMFLFAAAGVCLGLNDVWRLPALVMEHGSFWFPLLYLAGVFVIGVPLLVAELALTRLGRSRPAENFGFIMEGSNAAGLWQYAGLVVLVAVFLIISYTTVVASWMTSYAVRAVTGGLEDISLGAARLMFHALITDPERLLGWHTLFVLVLAWVAARGAGNGLGRVSRVLVTVVLALAAALATASLTAYGSGALAAVSPASGPGLTGALVADALSQSFFTLGVCMGAMLILGHYLPGEVRLGKLVAGVVGLDVLFVALSCIAVLPALASEESAGAEGVAFAMETVPMLLSNAPVGRLYLAAFYVLLLLLVATTALVLMELLVAWVGHKTRWPRRKAASAAAIMVWVGGLVALLSFSVLSFDFEFAGEVRSFGLFDVMDILSSQILLPIIGVLMTVFVGWHIARPDFQAAMGWSYAATVLHHMKRYWIPLVVAAILVILVFGRVP